MLKIWKGTYLEVGTVIREFNECRLGFTAASGCVLRKLALLLGFFPGSGKCNEGYSKTGLRADLATLRHIPSRQPLREWGSKGSGQRALWEGGSCWSNKQRLADGSLQEGWSTIMRHGSQPWRRYFALEEGQNIWSLEPWSDADRTFWTVIRKTLRDIFVFVWENILPTVLFLINI